MCNMKETPMGFRDMLRKQKCRETDVPSDGRPGRRHNPLAGGEKCVNCERTAYSPEVHSAMSQCLRFLSTIETALASASFQEVVLPIREI